MQIVSQISISAIQRRTAAGIVSDLFCPAGLISSSHSSFSNLSVSSSFLLSDSSPLNPSLTSA